MEINLVFILTPVFFLLMAIEYLCSLQKKRSQYHLSDFANNINSGVLEESIGLVLKGLLIFNYQYVFQHYALFSVDTASPLAWFVLWLGVDFLYYWFHRSAHRINFFWLGHSVHHQSEHYNLSVAFRQGVFQLLTSWVFYLPLALLGFPTWMFLLVASVNTLYQFWLHTEIIKRLGWFEHLFNTPSHHRVHHGTNPEYIDKNYGGSLIIWDKLFGTFAPEQAKVTYGVTEPLNSWNPFYANIKVIVDTLYYGKGLKRLFHKVAAFFMPPEWILRHLDTHNLPAKRILPDKYRAVPAAYMLGNTLIVVVSSLLFSIDFHPQSSQSGLLASFMLLSMYEIGCVSHGKKALSPILAARAVLLGLILNMVYHPPFATSIIGALVFFSLNYGLLQRKQRTYWRSADPSKKVAEAGVQGG
ncbi:MAG: sterol desaturase family protein [Legionellaceae bacterium]|nr:sterol desaturase family protein [Legionellaceae bacterium]